MSVCIKGPNVEAVDDSINGKINALITGQSDNYE
jgi:hypothetical protein